MTTKIGMELGVWLGVMDAQQPISAIPGSALLFGLMLFAAITGGYLAHVVRVPRVVGYLLAGVALKTFLNYFLSINPESHSVLALVESSQSLKAVTDIGLGVILFSIGSVFEVRHFRTIGRRSLKISLCESGLTFALVFVGSMIVGMLAVEDATALSVLPYALLLGFAGIATAPAATLFVLREYDAKGPTSDTILGLTGLNNVTCIVLFHVCFALLAAFGVIGTVSGSGGGGGGGGGRGEVWIDLLTLTIGSAALGVVLGFALSVLHAKLRRQDTLLILVAVLILAGAGEGWLLEHHNLSYNFLLLTLCMGATFVNVAIDPSSLETSLQDMSRPILVGFFVIAGYQLHLADLGELQYLGVAYIVCRIVGKTAGVYAGLRWARGAEGLPPMLGTALLCQAAVVIGLADYVETYWQAPWAGRFKTVVLGSVVVFELIGPILTKAVVKQSGEVKAVTLLRRTSRSERAPIVILSWRALMRAIGLGAAGKQRGTRSTGEDAGELLARDVMRTNIKCIAAGADFDEVLRFVEQSRFNHFPVVDDDMQLVGVIHFSDIQGIMYDPHLVGLMTAADIADQSSRPVPADMGLDDVLALFQRLNLGSHPVVESAGSRRVIGIIEQRDVLRAAHLHRADSG
jgi:Kef-type K+ transport system membrane component KefB/predicted transcriptional regulator